MMYIKKFEHWESEFDELLANSLSLFNVLRSLNIRLIKEVLDKGININIQNKIGRTPLICVVSLVNASQSDILPVVKLFIKYGADINIQDNYGSTALIKSVTFNRLYVADELIKNGADWELKNDEGNTFLDFLFYKADGFNINTDVKGYIERLKNKYPDKFEKYMMQKNAKKYNL